jgi:hypothetical protein
MFICPMLLHKVEEPFDNNDKVSELILDGIRLAYSKWFKLLHLT